MRTNIDIDDEVMEAANLVLFGVLRGFRAEREYLQAEALMSGFTIEPSGGFEQHRGLRAWRH